MLDKTLVNDFLKQCQYERRLSCKTINAYKCDLSQFQQWSMRASDSLTSDMLHDYLAYLNERYAPASTKRKIATLRALMSWATENKKIERSPFEGLKIRIREPKRLPRTIALADLKLLFHHLYDEHESADSHSAARNRAIIEVLIATGIRVSELCSLDIDSLDIAGRALRVAGKGDKERVVQLENEHTLAALKNYIAFRIGHAADGEKALFLNRSGRRMSDRAVREMLNRLAQEAGLTTHITPHMFRHTFATLLLEGDVDIRYIQKLLGHSSISTTEIYVHVTSAKLRTIMRESNPRKVIEA